MQLELWSEETHSGPPSEEQLGCPPRLDPSGHPNMEAHGDTEPHASPGSSEAECFQGHFGMKGVESKRPLSRPTRRSLPRILVESCSSLSLKRVGSWNTAPVTVDMAAEMSSQTVGITLLQAFLSGSLLYPLPVLLTAIWRLTLKLSSDFSVRTNTMSIIFSFLRKWHIITKEYSNKQKYPHFFSSLPSFPLSALFPTSLSFLPSFLAFLLIFFFPPLLLPFFLPFKSLIKYFT